MASNNGGLQDKDGDFSDWIEITNPSSEPANLNGWYLTDSASNKTKWQLPNVSIPAGGTLVVFASSKNLQVPGQELHTNFALGAGGEYLGLILPDGVTPVSQYAPSFPAQTANVSYGYLPEVDTLVGNGAQASVFVPNNDALGTTWTTANFNDAAWSTGLTGVGFGSNFAGLVGKNVQSAMQNVNSSIYVRVPFEVGSLAAVDALHLKMQYDDGFVAYLNGVEVARNDAPAIVTWNSSAADVTGSGPSTIEFDISSHLDLLVEGDNVLAIHGLNASVGDGDFLISPELVAYDLDSGAPTYIQVPTPGAFNLPSSVSQVSEVEFSHERGFYDTAFSLVLSSATTGATIYYTTDGSPPTPTTGTAYTGPITINTTSVIRAMAVKAGLFGTKVQTSTFLFLADVIHQPENIAGWPNPVQDVGNGKSARHDYEMDPAIVNNPAYSQALLDGLTSIPTLAVSVDFDTMWGSSGFYQGDAEVPMSVEIIDPNNPSQNTQADGGIEGHSHDRLKRSLRISFKSEYGPNKLLSSLLQNAPLNGDTASNRLDNIVLRAGNNRAWSRDWNSGATTFTEDQWYRDTQLAMTGYGSHGTFVHLYINGVYWGLYNPSERPDEDFSARYFGGSDDDYWSINHDSRTEGDSTQWDYLTDDLIDRDTTNPAVYQEIQDYLDVAGFSDYLLLNWYQATTDWPGNNWFAGNSNAEQGPVRFYAWDGEWSWDVSQLYSVNGAWIHPNFRTNGSGSAPVVQIWHALRDNDDFMMQFADRAYKHLANDGALTDAKSLERWNTLNEYIFDAVVAESARWGDSLDSLGRPTRTRDVDWQNEVNKIANLMVGNSAKLIAALRSQGFYPTIDPATFSVRGGTLPVGYQIQLTAPAGTIYYTLDGSDPRQAGGGISPSAIAYSGSGLPILSDGTVKVRVLAGGEWSAIDQATFDTVLSGNAPPFVSAGADQTVTLAAGAALVGTVTDDALPDNTLTSTWSVVTGPGAVTFGDAAQLSTSASFSAPGVYVLRLAASDGQFTITDNVTIVVGSPNTPTVLSLALVNANTNQVIPGFESLQNGAILNLATLPTTNLNVVAVGSSTVSSIVFGLDGNSNYRTETTAPFALFGDSNGDFYAGAFTLGTHTLTAIANPGPNSGPPLSVTFTVINQGGAPNQAPVVSAGDNKSVQFPGAVSLTGSATDDGFPGGPLVTTWSVVSGPGTVTFGNAALPATTATFSTTGVYVLQLSAFDGEYTTTSEVTITCTTEPVGPSVLSLSLINASTELPVPGYETISSGAILNLALLPAGLNFAANVNEGVSGVLFGYDTNASFRTETVAPFALFGDTNGNFASGTLTLGTHTIVATPIANNQLQQPLTITFTVINQVPPTNQAPVVSAGETQSVLVTDSLTLAGTVSDDGLPSGNVTTTWSVLNGPGSVTFGNAADPNTTASFSAPGTYVLQLTANDGQLSGSSSVTIHVTSAVVNVSPTVEAGANQSVVLPNSVSLSGTASDDGLPSSTLTSTWTKVSGPGNVAFGNAAQLSTSATFSSAGTYVLRLTVSDGELSSTDEVTITASTPVGPAVLSLTLINANNEQPIPGFEAIQPGSVINLALLPTTNLNVRANVSGNVGSVRFGLDSNANHLLESSAPYALFGDSSGNYHAGSFAIGNHTITATPYPNSNGNGTPGLALTVPFTVVNQLTNQAPVVSAGPNRNIVLSGSASLAGSVTDDGLPNGTITSTWSKISGPGNVTFGNTANPSTSATFSQVGSYVLQLSATDGIFTSTSTVTVNVTTAPVGPTVTSLTLINANTDQPIPGFENLTNGMHIDLSSLPTSNLNIRANTSGSIGSIKFGFDGNANFRNEGSAPYALFGDSNGNYHGVQIPAGTHTVSATPYSNSNGTGTVGQGMTITFTVGGSQQLQFAALTAPSDPTAFYRLWKETFGSTTDLTADANNNGRIDLGDYTLWRDNMGSLGFSLIVPAYEEVVPETVVMLDDLSDSEEIPEFYMTESDPSEESATTSSSATSSPSSNDAALLLLTEEESEEETDSDIGTSLIGEEPSADDTAAEVDAAFGEL